MRIKVHRSAKIDLLEGKLFYDDKQLGLGDYFESSLESDIESLKLYAGIHPKHRGFYKALSERFPYSIYPKFVSWALGRRGFRRMTTPSRPASWWKPRFWSSKGKRTEPARIGIGASSDRRRSQLGLTTEPAWI